MLEKACKPHIIMWRNNCMEVNSIFQDSSVFVLFKYVCPFPYKKLGAITSQLSVMYVATCSCIVSGSSEVCNEMSRKGLSIRNYFFRGLHMLKFENIAWRSSAPKFAFRCTTHTHLKPIIHLAVCLTTGPSLFQSELSTQCDLELPPSDVSILSFP
jgi:hypothetical protein